MMLGKSTESAIEGTVGGVIESKSQVRPGAAAELAKDGHRAWRSGSCL
jgi:hypothetical protein